MALPVLWDAELCAAEIRRVSGEGLPLDDVHREPGRARLPELPRRRTGTRCGRRSSTTDTVLNVHLGSSGKLARHRARRADRRDDHAAADEHRAGRRRPRCGRASFKEYPDLKVALLRGRHRLDPVLPRPARPHLRHAPTCGRARTSATSCRPRCSASTSSPASSPTRSGVQLRDEIGIDNICWELDYPHSDSSWPERPRGAPRGARREYDVPDDEINKMTHENAMRWYRFDPFAIRPKEQCTVGGAPRRGCGSRRVGALHERAAQAPQRDLPRRARGQGDRVARYVARAVQIQPSS